MSIMKIILETNVKPGDGVTAPLSVVLRRHESSGGLMVHERNHQDGGYYGGHYFEWNHWQEAMSNFMDRAARLGVVPTIFQ